ncbi:unnamed protein product [Triticum turgidum subsp. durum]|uniref:RRM domain-containing protein n=1 Tax=Triticum turgidum subsp. durum TaxID=4567 RepID=A0A9R0V411_TRITD|nr:unnamed protein product [Triticum turgidum subsp. durum]
MPSTPSMAPDLVNASNSYYMLLRELFFRLVFGLQVESSLSMEIIAFWLWLQGNGQVDFLGRIYSFGDNHFRALVSSAKRFLEVLHFGFDDLANRSIPRSDFKKEAVEGISLYLNGICYEALEDLRERIEMDSIHNQRMYLRHDAYGQSMTDRVPVGSEHLLTKIKALYVNTPNHDGEDTSSRNTHVQTSHINDEVHDYQSTSRLVTSLDSLSLREKHNDVIMQQPSDVPKSSKDLLTKIKALYANTPKHPGEGTGSRNIHVQRSQMHHGEGSSSRNNHAQTSHMFRHDYQSTLDKLSLRENHNDAIMQQLSDVPPDERTLFVTFSNGYPLTEDELYDFFMSHYGDIEEISIEVPFEDRLPLYAHVTFYSQLTLFRVLDGNMRVKFMTCSGKHIRARQFVPKKKK